MCFRLNFLLFENEKRTFLPLLVEYFIDRYARKAGKEHKVCRTRRRSNYCSPTLGLGNIRELQNVIERSVIVCETE